jgi:hypothetical protein
MEEIPPRATNDVIVNQVKHRRNVGSDRALLNETGKIIHPAWKISRAGIAA